MLERTRGPKETSHNTYMRSLYDTDYLAFIPVTIIWGFFFQDTCNNFKITCKSEMFDTLYDVSHDED